MFLQTSGSGTSHLEVPGIKVKARVHFYRQVYALLLTGCITEISLRFIHAYVPLAHARIECARVTL